jgi:hypothetical protein
MVENGNVRFELKEIQDGMRELSEHENSLLLQSLERKLVPAPMGDSLVPDRVLHVTRPEVSTRVLEGSLGIEGATYGEWTEKVFDNFFASSFAEGGYYWILPTPDGPFKPLFWAPYSAARRDYLYVYASDWGMRPCGITSIDGAVSLMADLDSEFTLVYGTAAAIAAFDVAFGGKQQVCDDLLSYLDRRKVDFGNGDIYGFLRIYLPGIGG